MWSVSLQASTRWLCNRFQTKLDLWGVHASDPSAVANQIGLSPMASSQTPDVRNCIEYTLEEQHKNGNENKQATGERKMKNYQLLGRFDIAGLSRPASPHGMHAHRMSNVAPIYRMSNGISSVERETCNASNQKG